MLCRYLGVCATLVRVLLLCFVFLSAANAWGHDGSLSAIRVMLEGNSLAMTVTTHQAALELSAGARLDPVDTDLAIRSRTYVYAGDVRIQPKLASLSLDTKSGMSTWSARLPWSHKPVTVRQGLYPEDKSSKCLVTIYLDGKAIFDDVYAAEKRQEDDLALAQPLAFWHTTIKFLQNGVYHIFTGIDHVCFVIALVLLGGTVGSMLRVLTGFTVAHSLTLACAVLGIYAIPSWIVEPLIALSIVVVAVDNVARLRSSKSQENHACKWRAYLAFAFGLLHGFGFAGALGALKLAGLPLLTSLLAFNVGVEVGQVCIAGGVLLGILALTKNKVLLVRHVRIVGSITVGVAGSVWFVQRVLGILNISL